MKTPVLDFIGSKTLRKQLEGQKLPPAIECIIIAQCREKSLAYKLEALEERYEANSADDLKKGIYNSFAEDFKTALYEYIGFKRRLLNGFANTGGEKVFVISADDYTLDGTICKSYEQAVSIVKEKLADERCKIIKRGADGISDDVTLVELNERQTITDASTYGYEDVEYNVQNAFAQIPHKFSVGDIVRSGDIYAVVADVTIHDTKPDYMKHSDYTDMVLYCMSYFDDVMHSCGGSFCHQHFPILETEICPADELPEKYKPLIALSKALKGELRFADFLEAYSDRRLLEY